MMYVEKRGTLNVGLRLEWLFARQHVTFVNANQAKNKPPATLREHLRFHDKAGDAPKEKKEMTVADQARLFASQTSQPAKKAVKHG